MATRSSRLKLFGYSRSSKAATKWKEACSSNSWLAPPRFLLKASRRCRVWMESTYLWLQGSEPRTTWSFPARTHGKSQLNFHTSDTIFEKLWSVCGYLFFDRERVVYWFVFNLFACSFNTLDLPEYPTKELMYERLLFAVKETSGFGMAWTGNLDTPLSTKVRRVRQGVLTY